MQICVEWRHAQSGPSCPCETGACSSTERCLFICQIGAVQQIVGQNTIGQVHFVSFDFAKSQIEFDNIVIDWHGIWSLELDEVLKCSIGCLALTFSEKPVKSCGYLFDTVVAFQLFICHISYMQDRLSIALPFRVRNMAGPWRVASKSVKLHHMSSSFFQSPYDSPSLISGGFL